MADNDGDASRLQTWAAMGLPAWADEAQNNPQMARKSLSFKRRSWEEAPATRMSRAAPLTVHVDATERTGEL